MRKQIIIALILAISFVNNSYGYEFSYKSDSYSIDDSLKSKLDIFINKKMPTVSIRLKYFNLIKKYDSSFLDERKKGIINYLLLRLEPVKKNIPIVPPLADSSPEDVAISQEPINIPVTVNVSPVADTPRTILNDYSSTTEKNYIEQIKKGVKEFAEVNDKYEFAEYGKTYRVNLDEYYKVEFKNPVRAYLQIPTLSKEILYKRGGSFYISHGGYDLEQKKTLKEISEQALLTSESDEGMVFKKVDDYYYGYGFYNFKYYSVPDEGIYLSQYPAIKSLKDIILLKRDGKYIIVSDFKTQKLFTVSYLSKIKNPLEVLRAVGKDLYFYKSTDIENVMFAIKDKTDSVIAGAATDSQKIKLIYSWITKNLVYDAYSKKFIDGKFDEKTYLANVDNNVFTGLGSFKTMNSVCDGYSKLTLYMLSFAGIDSSIEIGKADVGGGKLISHAWNRIGSRLYDTTWDSISVGDASKFRWFALNPEDMYKTHFKD